MGRSELHWGRREAEAEGGGGSQEWLTRRRGTGGSR